MLCRPRVLALPLAVALLTRLPPGVLVTRPLGLASQGSGGWVSRAWASCSAGADGPDGAEGPGVNVLPYAWTRPGGGRHPGSSLLEAD